VGQKVHPLGFRLGIVKGWQSVWFADKSYARLLKEDDLIRRYIHSRLGHAAISKVVIERTPQKMTVIIHTARPGVVIGRKGQEVDKLRDELAHLSKDEIFIKIEEIKTPELDSQLVADGIAFQLGQRVSFRRAMKKAVTSAMRMNAQGIKIICGGRLAGAEIARSEGYLEGRVPLHTIRADIDYATSTAHTTFGTIGVKIWICKGEIIQPRSKKYER
jgi:small subunit ribosomal protein S3